ncbi:hypothetical protein [Mesorhizobium sp. B4-1-4]|uniref:hypothetical protein n=2 Tax=Mesorhizobium TaxID=68287 RepID=UPI0011279E54|nr:hypothetical protein [Mesorhizobium sp. B4-1-4]UCI34960.1 hypothetical protein FJW03_02075 [Mesorhizobium sp. B4-1-4]
MKDVLAEETRKTRGEEPSFFDTMILATGVRHAYFGHDECEPFAPGLKTLEDATKIGKPLRTFLQLL